MQMLNTGTGVLLSSSHGGCWVQSDKCFALWSIWLQGFQHSCVAAWALWSLWTSGGVPTIVLKNAAHESVPSSITA